MKLIFKIIIPVFFLLISLEIILRFASAHLSGERAARLKIQTEDVLKLRVLTIGESTTDQIMAEQSGVHSWPKQLEQLMNSYGVVTRVYNVGESGSNSYFLMKDLKENIKLFKPHIVVSMMGINDVGYYGAYENTLWDSIKLIKLVEIYKRLIQNKSNKLLESRTIDLKLLRSLVNKIRNENLSAAKAIEIVENAKFTNKDKFLFISEVVDELTFGVQNKNRKFKLIYELIGEARKLNYYTKEFISSTVFAYDRANFFNDCIDFALSVQQHLNYTFDKTSMNSVLHCYENSTLKNSSAIKKFFLNQTNSIVLRKSSGVMRDNYKYLFDILKEQKIELFAMQYPTQRREDLQGLFGNEQHQEVYFVSNDEVFTEALKNKKYEDLFIDSFAGEFGHATSLGNQIIAKQAFAAIVNYSKSFAAHKKPEH